MREGMQTPWGPVQYFTAFTEGIWSCSTASHGGFKLDRSHNSKMPDYMRLPGGWYEEDCNWCLPATIFSELFDEKSRKQAEETLKNWHPDAYEKFYKTILKPGESYKRTQKLFKEKHQNDWVVISAIGDWHEDVPEGMVLVYATIGESRERGKEEKSFLIPTEEYRRTRGRFGFVIDLNCHKEIPIINRYQKEVGIKVG